MDRFILLITASLLLLTSFTDLDSEGKKVKEKAMVTFLRDYIDIKYGPKDYDTLIYIATRQQRLYLIADSTVVSSYPISTATNGTGTRVSSKKTPTGLHRIRVKAGDNVPMGGILKDRVYYGEIAPIITEPINIESDDITTRVLWLEGLEPGVNRGGNRDTFNRQIYIHGTPEEGLIGKPASHGCIRMKNTDILQLYNLTSEGTVVIILRN